MNKKLLTVLALPFIALPIVACGPSHSGYAKADATKAKKVATVEDAQLKADGYSALHVPGFGWVDIGIKGHTYEAVINSGKLTDEVVYDADKKPQPGVTVRKGSAGTDVVVDAASLRQLKKGVEALVSKP